MTEFKTSAQILREDGLPDFLNRLLNPEGNSSMIRITTNAARLPETSAAVIASIEPIPALTVPCPFCNQPAGSWCRSQAGKKPPELHAARKPGAAPMLAAEPVKPAAVEAANLKEADVTKTSSHNAGKTAGSKLETTTAKSRREPGSRPARPEGSEKPKKPDLKATTAGSGPKPKAESKTALVDRLLHAKLGVTREKLSEATGWPSVNLRVAAGRCPQDVMLVNEGGRYRLMPKAEFDALPFGEAQLWQKVKF